jgi:hypothetical protein
VIAEMKGATIIQQRYRTIPVTARRSHACGGTSAEGEGAASFIFIGVI